MRRFEGVNSYHNTALLLAKEVRPAGGVGGGVENACTCSCTTAISTTTSTNSSSKQQGTIDTSNWKPRILLNKSGAGVKMRRETSRDRDGCGDAVSYSDHHQVDLNENDAGSNVFDTNCFSLSPPLSSPPSPSVLDKSIAAIKCILPLKGKYDDGDDGNGDNIDVCNEHDKDEDGLPPPPPPSFVWNSATAKFLLPMQEIDGNSDGNGGDRYIFNKHDEGKDGLTSLFSSIHTSVSQELKLMKAIISGKGYEIDKEGGESDILSLSSSTSTTPTSSSPSSICSNEQLVTSQFKSSLNSLYSVPIQVLSAGTIDAPPPPPPPLIILSPLDLPENITIKEKESSILHYANIEIERLQMTSNDYYCALLRSEMYSNELKACLAETLSKNVESRSDLVSMNDSPVLQKASAHLSFDHKIEQRFDSSSSSSSSSNVSSSGSNDSNNNNHSDQENCAINDDNYNNNLNDYRGNGNSLDSLKGTFSVDKSNTSDTYNNSYDGIHLNMQKIQVLAQQIENQQMCLQLDESKHLKEALEAVKKELVVEKERLRKYKKSVRSEFVSLNSIVQELARLEEVREAAVKSLIAEKEVVVKEKNAITMELAQLKGDMMEVDKFLLSMSRAENISYDLSSGESFHRSTGTFYRSHNSKKCNSISENGGNIDDSCEKENIGINGVMLASSSIQPPSSQVRTTSVLPTPLLTHLPVYRTPQHMTSSSSSSSCRSNISDPPTSTGSHGTNGTDGESNDDFTPSYRNEILNTSDDSEVNIIKQINALNQFLLNDERKQSFLHKVDLAGVATKPLGAFNSNSRKL